MKGLGAVTELGSGGLEVQITEAEILTGHLIPAP